MFRFATIAFATAALAAGSAQAVVITGHLYNTGVGAGGAALAAGNGQIDGNYTITAATHPGAAIGAAATYYNAAYAAENAGSRWIAFTGNIATIPSSPTVTQVAASKQWSAFGLPGIAPPAAQLPPPSLVRLTWLPWTARPALGVARATADTSTSSPAPVKPPVTSATVLPPSPLARSRAWGRGSIPESSKAKPPTRRSVSEALETATR